MSIGPRIRQARQMRGMSLRALASRVGVTAQAISKYERGLMTPSSAVLLRLATALGVRVEFFMRAVSVPEIMPCYRKASTLPRKQEAGLRGQVREWIERYMEVEQLRSADPEGFAMPDGFPHRVRRSEDVETAAEALREIWNLGLDPIENVTELLEDRGIKAGTTEAPAKFDACTFQAGDDGHIRAIVTRRDLPGDRQRFNLAHELGHIVLHPIRGIDAEKSAHRFAGAFLVPAPAVRGELGDHRARLSPLELHMLKHKYGLSMQAWISRARDLAIISENLAREYFRAFRRRGWHKREPGDQYPAERPSRFDRLLIQALEEDLISDRRAEELLGRPLPEFLNRISRDHDGLPCRLRD